MNLFLSRFCNLEHNVMRLLFYSFHLRLKSSNASKNQTLYASCKKLLHSRDYALGSYYESQTHACDFPMWLDLEEFGAGSPVQVDVFLGPRGANDRVDDGELLGKQLLNDINQPFYIGNNNHGSISTGLFNSGSRRRSGAIPFSWRNETAKMKNGSTEKYDVDIAKKLKVSACIIGVNYVSNQQQREIIQYYLTSGFEHVYLGVPQWPTSALFNQTLQLLGDFIIDGSLSLIVSEYASEFIEPFRFHNNFTYAPQGHKSSFGNTCLVVARAAGDDMVFVGDFDELVEHGYENSTSISEVIADQLSSRNMNLDDICAITLGAMTAHYHTEKAGLSGSGRILDKIAGVSNGMGSIDNISVNRLGKSFANVRRLLRAGLHGPAYCEPPPTHSTTPTHHQAQRIMSNQISKTRRNVLSKENILRPKGGSDSPPFRILHLIDSFMLRSVPSDYELAEKKKYVSYYARDWSDLVNADLRRRNRTIDG